MKKFYSLCKKSICIDAESFPGDNPLWAQFETAPCDADITISCTVSDCFPEVPSGVRVGDFTVSVMGDTVYRAFPMGNVPGALSVYTPGDTSCSKTFFTPSSFPIMMDSRYMWSSVSLAQLLLSANAFFLHSSFIEVNGKAVLFSAPCGVGKSTQAALWAKHRGAETINGDKAGILVEGGVYACGVPFCGTSGICKNKILPIGAIVLLDQAKVNSVCRLGGAQALQGILPNIYLDFVAAQERLKCTDLVIELLSRVPVFRLSCTPDEGAVLALEEALEGVI